MEWAELHSLHLGSSRGFRGRSIPKQPTRASKRESQLKISARLGVWRKWQVKEALSCPCFPHRTHLPLLFQPEVRNSSYGDTAEL